MVGTIRATRYLRVAELLGTQLKYVALIVLRVRTEAQYLPMLDGSSTAPAY